MENAAQSLCSHLSSTLTLFRFPYVIHTETVTLIVVTLNTMIAFGIDLRIE